MAAKLKPDREGGLRSKSLRFLGQVGAEIEAIADARAFGLGWLVQGFAASRRIPLPKGQ